MSDIYLQITETPTVVTLSAPVISGALSSTVTVANTVTVALDANSLSALENVTVTVGAAITGTVTVGNSVTISSLPAISGTVTIGSAIPAGTNRIGVVTIGAGTVTIGAGTAQIGSVTAGLAGWELLGQRDFNADGSDWVFSASIIGLYSSIGLTFGDSGSGSIKATYIPTNGQDNDVYWTSQDGSRVRIIGSGSGILLATAFPAVLNISVYASPSVSQTASLYGKKDNTVALTNTQLRASAISVSGSVTIGAGTAQIGSVTASISNFPATQPVSLTTLPALVEGTAQIGSVTASISGTVPISISSVTVGNSVTIGSLPALAAGTAQIGSVTASISNTVVTFYPMQGTTVTNSNFTSTTASTTLVSAVAGRDVLTVFNEGAGNLFISPGATATTISYQVRLSAGDYWECPEGQRSLAHTAVFATAGTARVTEVS